jgi:hypothetical protein
MYQICLKINKQTTKANIGHFLEVCPKTILFIFTSLCAIGRLLRTLNLLI